MTIPPLWQRAGNAQRKAQILRAVAQKVQAEVCQTLLMRQQQQREEREWREWERLRRLMPGANALTLNLTAQILVARGLDT
jgi:hypothetical protein